MAAVEAKGPGLGTSRRALLAALKRRGPSALTDLRADLALAPATVREHLLALTREGLVARHGTRKSGRGRPEVIWALTPAAEDLFPRRDGAVLHELVTWMGAHGGAELLGGFFEGRIGKRRQTARTRLARKKGIRRVAEVARMLSEEGYLAEAVRGSDGAPVLRIFHCPVKDLVAATDLPCRTELGLVRELLGGTLTRLEHAAHKQGTCSYGVPRGGGTPARPTAA
jgi:predicted ArsR family transcriptional regulator